MRDYNAQVGEILAGVKVMNKVIGLGMPVRQPRLINALHSTTVTASTIRRWLPRIGMDLFSQTLAHVTVTLMSNPPVTLMSRLKT